MTSVVLRAETPAPDYVFPAGGQQGTTNTITVGGKFDPWPAKVWIDCPGVEFEPQTNKGTFRVTIATNALIGPHLIRLFNSDGASVPKWFVVGTEREISEIEPNDAWKQAQRIDPLPIMINGRLEKGGDVDSFAIRLEAGKWVVASIDGYALGSPIDPNLTLLDEEGTRIAFNSDSRQTLDPLLEWKVEKSGTYIFQVTAFAFPPAADVRFAGSAAAVYRLSISQGPFVNSVFPASIPRDCKTDVELSGHNLSNTSGKRRWQLACPVSSFPSFLPAPDSLGKLRVAISDLPQEAEREPNNSAEQAQPLRWPITINGQIDPLGDEDRFVFDAKKGEKIEFRLRSGALGLPLDATLRIEDSSGKQIVRDDDSGEASDPLLNWTAPSNGTYRLTVSDLYRRGGPEFAYALEVRAPVPDVKVTVDASAFRIEPGKTNDVKLAITRSAGHTNNLQVAAVGLPAGISSKTVAASAKEKETKLSLIAAPDAKPADGPFQIEVTDSTTNLSRMATFDLRPKESRFGEMLISHIDQLWLTVATNAPPPDKPKEKKK